jgi:hypothetical protein
MQLMTHPVLCAMPTGSDTESGFYIGRWMERPVVNHFRVFLLRLPQLAIEGELNALR